MTPLAPLGTAVAAVLAAAVGYAVSSAVAGRARRRAEAERDALSGELEALKSKPGKQEYRIERYDLVWYPTITYAEADKTILAAAPGVPHCRACMLPLVLEREEWFCRQCGAKHAASLADTVVTDSIVNQALKWFSERHPGYRIPKT